MAEPMGAGMGEVSDLAEQFAQKALKFIDSVRLACGRYADRPRPRRPNGFALQEGEYLTSTALATAARYIVGGLSEPSLAAEREAIINFIQGKQSLSTGGYEKLSRDTPTAGRLDLPLFGWAVRALAMLGSKPALPVKFLRRWDDPEELTWWLGLLDWHCSARSEGMRVMNVGVPRIMAYRRGRKELEPSVYALMGWLQAHQDPASGFWGPAQGGDLSEGLGGTFHILVIYEAAGRAVPLAEHIARTVIDLWQPERGWGDLWHHMAALSVLQKTAFGGRDALEAKAKELARWTVELFEREGWTSISEVVTILEGLRVVAAILKDDETLRAARSWNSAWDPKLWVCDW